MINFVVKYLVLLGVIVLIVALGLVELVELVGLLRLEIKRRVGTAPVPTA